MSSSNSTDAAVAALTQLTQQISEVLSTTLAQSQENNRALAAICGTLSHEWSRATCSAGSMIMPPSMLGLIMAVSALVLLIQIEQR